TDETGRFRAYPTVGTLTPGDVDEFCYSAAAGVITVDLQAPGVHARLTLLDSSGDILAPGGTPGDGGSLVLPAAGPGLVYLRVESLDGSSGAYTLDTSLKLPEQLRFGSITEPGEPNLELVYVSVPTALTVQLDAAEGSGLDVLLTVRDVGFQVLAPEDTS